MNIRFFFFLKSGVDLGLNSDVKRKLCRVCINSETRLNRVVNHLEYATTRELL